MKRCSLKRNTRPKAMLGLALASAGIGALGNVIGSYQQAKAQEEQARMYADGIRQQNENAVKLQNQMIDVMKSENEKNRQLMATSSLNEAMQMGGENAKSIYNMNRIVLRKGGKVARRKLRNGNDAVPFRVLRGGEVLPIGQDNIGTIGIIAGRNHDHGGVDMNFRDGQKIEAEGGELIRIPMNGEAQAEILSRRTKNGFNPTAEVESGNMTFDEAFANQEMNKKMYRRSLKRTKAKAGRPVVYGGPFQNVYNFTPAYSDFDALGYLKATRPVDGVRNSYPNVLDYSTYHPAQFNFTVPNGSSISTTSASGNIGNPYSGFDASKYYDTLFSGVRASAAGNIIGGLTNLGGNLLAGAIGSRANNKAAEITAEAYRNLEEPDLNFLSDGSFKSPKALASFRSPVVSNTAELAGIERDKLAGYKSIANNTRSAAAQIAKRNKLAVDAHELISRSEEQKQKLEEAIKQHNIEYANDINKFNAELDAKTRSDKLNLAATLIPYKYDIRNKRITGPAEAYARARINNGQLWGNAITNSLQGLGAAFRDSQLGYSNAINAIVGDELEYNKIMATQDPVIQKRFNWNTNYMWTPNRRSLRNFRYNYY